MAKKKKKMPGLNTSSTADISFMLLIFFLVTTSMDSDKGLIRRLPPPPETQQKNVVQINERNIFTISISSDGRMVLCGDYGHPVEIDAANLLKLHEDAKNFITRKTGHPGDIANPAESTKKTDLHNATGMNHDECSDKHVISLQTDRGTQYEKYFTVQNELVSVYNEIRDELSKANFGKAYKALPEDLQAKVREVYPQNISEAEPINYAEKYGLQK